MGRASWRESYRTHIPEIDGQHIGLFETASALAEAIERGDGDHAVRRVLFTLLEYTRTHFATEESIMNAAAYPHAEAHAREHAQFVARVMRWLDAPGAVTPRDLLESIEQWLTTHIAKSDAAYAPYVLRKRSILPLR